MKHLTIEKYRFSEARHNGINPAYHYSRTFETGAEAEKWLANFIATTEDKLDYHSFNKEVANV